ncbi:hypothetical protein T439DRAFT_175713 [Meredithblackwellia eburnea MCA 4105]
MSGQSAPFDKEPKKRNLFDKSRIARNDGKVPRRGQTPIPHFPGTPPPRAKFGGDIHVLPPRSGDFSPGSGLYDTMYYPQFQDEALAQTNSNFYPSPFNAFQRRPPPSPSTHVSTDLASSVHSAATPKSFSRSSIISDHEESDTWSNLDSDAPRRPKPVGKFVWELEARHEDMGPPEDGPVFKKMNKKEQTAHQLKVREERKKRQDRFQAKQLAKRDEVHQVFGVDGLDGNWEKKKEALAPAKKRGPGISGGFFKMLLGKDPPGITWRAESPVSPQATPTRKLTAKISPAIKTPVTDGIKSSKYPQAGSSGKLPAAVEGKPKPFKSSASSTTPSLANSHSTAPSVRPRVHLTSSSPKPTSNASSPSIKSSGVGPLDWETKMKEIKELRDKEDAEKFRKMMEEKIGRCRAREQEKRNKRTEEMRYEAFMTQPMGRYFPYPDLYAEQKAKDWDDFEDDHERHMRWMDEEARKRLREQAAAGYGLGEGSWDPYGYVWDPDWERWGYDSDRLGVRL